MNKTTTVSCPTCGKRVEWSTQSQYRPFCSERCRLIDLGDWISEEHRIPGEGVQRNTDDIGHDKFN